MAYGTAARCKGAVNFLVLECKDMTAEAKLFPGQDKFIGSLLMAAVAHSRGVRAVFSISLHRFRGRGAGIASGVQPGFFFLGVRHTVEEKTEHFVSRFRRSASRYQQQTGNACDYERPFFHLFAAIVPDRPLASRLSLLLPSAFFSSVLRGPFSALPRWGIFCPAPCRSRRR